MTTKKELGVEDIPGALGVIEKVCPQLAPEYDSVSKRFTYKDSDEHIVATVRVGDGVCIVGNIEIDKGKSGEVKVGRHVLLRWGGDHPNPVIVWFGGV